MPKTLTGDELQLDDGPARDSELFLVDGNNLAYRAFFALPEELATTEGFPTNALLGFTNMLFKLLQDYRPKGVAVAWDTRPVERLEQLETYKSDRRPTPGLLGEQFPYFRPIVEAFGYRNLEFQGWEADDVIATLATRADEAGIKTTVVSTDRDAFQLVTDNVTLMMTPRGVADVNVYTPERVEARYGIRPDQIPDFIGLKGDTSDNIPGIPGIGDKTAGQLIAQYGSLEEVIAHADELTPARRKNIKEHAEQAAISKQLATMRRDLDLIGCDPAELVLQPPDRSQLKEMFRRFEFRGLLGRVDQLDEAVPSLPTMRPAGTAVTWREGDLPETTRAAPRSRSTTAASRSHATTASSSAPSTPRSRTLRLREAKLVAHDFKSLPRLTMTPAEDTMLAAYLIDPGRPAYELDDLAQEYGLEVLPEPATDEETAALVRHAEAARRLAPVLRERLRERGSEELYDRIELPLAAVLASMEDAGRQDRHVPHGRDHRAARRPGRGARDAGARARGRGVHARLDAAGRPDPVREARADPRPQGQDRLLDGHARPALDPPRARDRRRDRGVARVLEARQHVPPAAAVADLTRGRPPAHALQPGGRVDGPSLDVQPEPPGDPDPDGARPGDPLGLRRRAGAPARAAPTTRRSSCASSRTCRASRSCASRSRAARTSTRRPRRRCSARTRRR